MCVPAHAQDEGTEIIVTAQKRQQSLSDVPMSITAVSGDNLVQRGVTDVQGLAKLTPGLSVAESGNSVPVYSLRGIGFFDTSVGARPTVSVYVDEVGMPFSIMTQGASFDLERVEVLKGPQGTLFGQNATGGAINYIAAKPKDTLEAGLNGSFGRFNDLDVTAFVTGPITDTLKARVAVRGNISDGWQRSYTRDATLGDKKFLQGRVILDWEPTDTVRFSFNANGFLDKSDTQAPQLLQVLPQAPKNADR
ncbi:MAG: TonB-dependent receptor, partial [Sphingobium sp.]